MTTNPPRWSLLAALVLANVLWGASYAVIRVTVERTPPLVLAALSCTAAAALLWGLHAVFGERRAEPVPARDALRMGLLGNVGVSLNLGLTYEALTLTGATDASLMIVGESVATVLLSMAILRERLRPRTGLGIGLGILGVSLVMWSGGTIEGGGSARILGDVLLLGSTLADAVYNVLGTELARRYDASTLLRWALTGTLPVWALVLVHAAVTGGLPAPDWPLLAGIAWITGVQTVGCFTLWFAALARLGTHAGAVSVALQPLTGVLVGALVLAEPLSGLMLLGGACVVVALLVTAGDA